MPFLHTTFLRYFFFIYFVFLTVTLSSQTFSLFFSTSLFFFSLSPVIFYPIHSFTNSFTEDVCSFSLDCLYFRKWLIPTPSQRACSNLSSDIFSIPWKIACSNPSRKQASGMSTFFGRSRPRRTTPTPSLHQMPSLWLWGGGGKWAMGRGVTRASLWIGILVKYR